MNYKNYLEKLKEINELSWVRNYLDLKVKPNFWTIIEYGKCESSKDKSAHETRMSKMIRWMMDPNENHDLGNVFAYKLMALLGEDYDYFPGENKDVKSIAEYRDIDIFYKDLSQKMCLAIELKQYAKEGQSEDGTSQLDKYERIVDKLANEKDFEPHYVFLTPLKDKPSNKKWKALGYKEFIGLINEVKKDYIIKSKSPYREDTRKKIMDFTDELQRTLDISKKDNSYISEKLSSKEKKFTSLLAKEIREDTNSERMDKLMEINKDEDLDLKELIFVVEDHLNAQNHTPNDEIKILIKKIYNALSGGEVLDLDPAVEYTVEKTKTKLKPDLINLNGIKFTKMELTSKKQGINIYTEDDEHRIYMSGDSHGEFPNHGVQLLKNPKDGTQTNSQILKLGSFQVRDNLILEDKIHDKNGNLVAFDQLMESYVIPALKELSKKVD